MKARAKVRGYFQGIERMAGEEFEFDPKVATLQGLTSAAIELLEPIPEDVERPEPEAARGQRPPAAAQSQRQSNRQQAAP